VVVETNHLKEVFFCPGGEGGQLEGGKNRLVVFVRESFLEKKLTLYGYKGRGKKVTLF